MTGRPVVVNSLLCFLNNYRDHENIERIVDQYFTLENRKMAYQILLELVPDEDRRTVLQSTSPFTLIALYDYVSKLNAVLDQPPVFATDDLTILPLSLNYDNKMGRSKDLYDEVRQLRLYVQNTFERKQEEPFVLKRHVDELHTKAADNSESHTSSSPANSPQAEVPTSTVITSGHQFHVNALLRNDNPTEDLTSPVASADSKLSRRIGRTNSTEQPRRRKDAGNRLDRAVRRLTDRLGGRQNFGLDHQFDVENVKEEETDVHTLNNNEKCSRNNSLTPFEMSDCTDEVDGENIEDYQQTHNNNNNNLLVSNLVGDHSSMFNSTAANILLSRHAALLGRVQNAAAHAVAMVDPMTAQVIQNLATATLGYSAASIPSSLEPTNGESLNDELPSQAQSDEFVNEHEKSSGGSSPAPSDSSTPQDADKPFACSQLNCKKRFSNKFLLKKHQFIHTGLRPHACPFCAKQFNRKDNLLRHKKTHVNNALAQLTGRRRLYGVTEAANLANFSLFHSNPLINTMSEESS
ncbi:putative zinc finger protein [Aphelenchoides besseyi]|nr:putative zinc finger protein [Aphelenchoides besseyi]KAI6201046.1 putative zinc finger protein [Aphelenchoides besseyi]